MARKEFVGLIEQNMLALDRLGDKLKQQPKVLAQYPRQQLTSLVRLHIGGQAKLKDIARREFVPTSNLCSLFRRLETDGLVLRTIDESDRRNTWYSVTPKGAEIAKSALAEFRSNIEDMFKCISKEDEAKLTDALKSMNEVLNKLEKVND